MCQAVWVSIVMVALLVHSTSARMVPSNSTARMAAPVTPWPLSAANTAKYEKMAMAYYTAAEKVQREPKNKAALGAMSDNYYSIALSIKDWVLKSNIKGNPSYLQSRTLATIRNVLVKAADKRITFLTKVLKVTKDPKKRASLRLDIRVDQAYRAYYAKS